MIELVPRKQYEQIKATLRQRAQRISSSPFEARFDDFLTVGIYHFIAGAQDFAGWSGKMQEDFGESIRPHVEEIWLGMPGQARKIADRLLAPILKHVEIAEIETDVSQFAVIKRGSAEKYTPPPQPHIRSAAPMPFKEVDRIVTEPGEKPKHQSQAEPISQRKLEPEITTVPAVD